MIQSGGFLSRPFRLIKVVLPLKKNVFAPLTKSVLIQLGLTAATSTTNSRIIKHF